MHRPERRLTIFLPPVCAKRENPFTLFGEYAALLIFNDMSSITAFAGSIPHNYETYLGPLFFEPYAVDLVQRLEGGDYGSVLELACGTGRLTKHLVNKLAPDGRLQATDLNEDM